MWALGELIIAIIYIGLGLSTVVFFLAAIMIKPKTLSFILFIVFGSLLMSFKSCQDKNYQKNQMGKVGVYYLSNYPNCEECFIELKENMTYKVLRVNVLIEEGDWHNASSGDYFATHLNGDKDQLGSGKYSYNNYKLKY